MKKSQQFQTDKHLNITISEENNKLQPPIQNFIPANVILQFEIIYYYNCLNIKGRGINSLGQLGSFTQGGGWLLCIELKAFSL